MIYIYGRMSCPYCVKAIELCKKQGVQYQYLDADQKIREVAAMKGHFTVPIVFDKLTLIGGYEELRKKLTVHNTWQKISWWLVTAFHFFHCKQTYRTRMNARMECYLNGRK